MNTRSKTVEKAFGLTIPRTLEDVCNPVDMALLVYDMQVGIVSQIPDGPAVVARVKGALATARGCGMRVCFTRHMSLPREFMGSFQYRMAMNWQRVDRVDEVRPWFLPDSPGFQIVGELAPQPAEPIFD
jgi:biuret amidohydrolase